MNIEVKGTKTTSTSDDPAAPYAQRDPERPSVVPKALALAFMGVALYLKSIFPALAGRSADSQEGAGGDIASALPAGDPLVAGLQSDGDLQSSTEESRSSLDGAGPTESTDLSVPVAVIRMTDISHRVERFTLDSIAVTVQPDLGGLFRWENVSNDIGSPAVSARHGTGPAMADRATPVVAQDPQQRDDDDQDPEEPVDKDKQGTNRAPRADGPVKLFDVSGTSIMLIGLADLLRNSVDPDGDALSVTGVSASSGLISVLGGEWTYQASGEYTQSVTLNYIITDGEFEISQTAHFTAIRPFVQGTSDDDLLTGTQWADDITGDAGIDNIDGRQGNDVIKGGDGADHILGGDGNDTIFGDDGDDILLGQDGDDHLFGGSGDDLLYGGDGDDLLVGGEGDDTLDAGDGDDLLEGDAGDDLLIDGMGQDVAIGGAGDDVVLAATDGADDFFSEGDGFDTIDYSQSTGGIVIDLNQGIATSTEIGTDTIQSFEHVIGGTGDDHFIIGPSPSILSGGAGENTFEFIPDVAIEHPRKITHEITDFKHGDNLRMSDYMLFDEVVDEFEDEFEAMYGDEFDDDDIPIRIRHDTVEDVRRTIVDADLNFDDIFETTVFIQGHHVLLITDMTV